MSCSITTRNPSRGPQEEHRPIKAITEADLAAVLKLFNDEKARQFFAKTPIEAQLDGSALSITVGQKSYALRFTAQSPFDKDAPTPSAELGRVALALFKLAGIAIPAKDLY